MRPEAHGNGAVCNRTKLGSTVESDATVLIQLSDIHFKSDKSAQLLLLDEVKRELVRDIELIEKDLPPVKLVLVCGDVAFSGAKEEYLAAKAWLKDFCRAANCREEAVRTVPGNHDVNRRG
jgi:3',5'-cyclic AMP phosphodiesterase CpdA